MGKFYETEEFKKTQDEWYNKLKQKGFRDAEVRANLTTTSHHAYRHHPTAGTRYARLEYYQLIGHAVSTTRFTNIRDELVMLFVADGFKIKEIVQKLLNRGYPLHRKTVMFIIRRYELKWGVRFWSPQQLTSNRVTK